MSKLIIANWKNNPATEEEAVVLAQKTDYENVVICPPDRFLKTVGLVIKKSKLGAQDLVKDVEYAIIGHSDKRKLGETNETTTQKVMMAVEWGIVPILCVGETWEQKQNGEKEKVITEQVKLIFQKLKNENFKLKIYVAYEPVWAISTSGAGKGVGSVKETLLTIKFIKSLIQGLNIDAHFLYGGSVNSKNSGDFLQHADIEGVLVGGASLNPEEFCAIIKTNPP